MSVTLFLLAALETQTHAHLLTHPVPYSFGTFQSLFRTYKRVQDLTLSSRNPTSDERQKITRIRTKHLIGKILRIKN